MKNLLLSILLLKTALGFCQEAVFNVKYPVVKFPKTVEGIKRNFVFEFKNSGAIPLEIYSVDVQCTCIDVTLSNDVIHPGQGGKLEVVFDTNGKLYHQDHSIILITNTTKRREKLRFKIFVEPKPNTKG